jgi:photosystem II stability/assembly factor-like uncharacterized protein
LPLSYASLPERLGGLQAIAVLQHLLDQYTKMRITRAHIALTLTTVAVAAVLSTLSGTLAAQSDPERLALIIGNGAYEGGTWSPLSNPVHDVTAISNALTRLGFQVIGCGTTGVCRDVTRADMDKAIREFGRRLRASPGAIAFVYYSGHGVQARRSPDSPDENFMVPVHSGIEEDFEVPDKAISERQLIDTMVAVSVGYGIVVLDACRENGLKSSGKAADVKGLASSEANDFLIAYAAQPGHMALDRVPGTDSQLSPYARRLAEKLVVPGRSITDVFLDVRAAVVADTKGFQRPQAVMELSRNIILAPLGAQASSQTDAQVPLAVSVSGAVDDRHSISGGDVNAQALSWVRPSLLRSVHVRNDGLHVWAVGDDGAAIVSPDGGKRWFLRDFPTRKHLRSLQFAVDDLHGWVAGDDGSIFATDDAGQHWVKQSTPDGPGLYSVSFALDGLHGWAVGQAGRIIATDDGGKTWVKQASPSAVWLNGVHAAPDGRQAWAVGPACILATYDSGKRWTFQSVPIQAQLNAVQFLADGRRGWAVGADGAVITTEDGGGNWRVQNSKTVDDLQSVYFEEDGLHGWATVSATKGRQQTDGGIISTNDGGRSWTRAASPHSASLQSIRFARDGMHGWAVGAHGVVFASADGGKSWIEQTTGDDPNLSFIHFAADGRRGWAAGVGGLLFATTDGGESWFKQDSVPHDPGMPVSGYGFSSDGLRGWAVQAQDVLTTSDGAHSWQRQSTAAGVGLQLVKFSADGLHGWAMGIRDDENGISHGVLVVTANGGRSWVKRSTPPAVDVRSIYLGLDGLHSLADGFVGSEFDIQPVIVATADGGKSWARGSVPELSASDVDLFADGLHGCAIFDGGAYVTTDGGKTWSQNKASVRGYLRHSFVSPDNQHAWALTSEELLESSDGCRTWLKQSEAAPLDSVAAMYFAADAMRGWAVGTHSRISSTEDGGRTWVTRR